MHHREGKGGSGRLHVYLGMAPGAGKTYARLAEGRRLADAGAGLLTRQGVQVARAVLEEVTNRLHWPG